MDTARRDERCIALHAACIAAPSLVAVSRHALLGGSLLSQAALPHRLRARFALPTYSSSRFGVCAPLYHPIDSRSRALWGVAAKLSAPTLALSGESRGGSTHLQQTGLTQPRAATAEAHVPRQGSLGRGAVRPRSLQAATPLTLCFEPAQLTSPRRRTATGAPTTTATRGERAVGQERLHTPSPAGALCVATDSRWHPWIIRVALLLSAMLPVTHTL
jgi:hypothetical protein